ncbi:MAG: energy transducer TonB [Lewinellaceae bacterium]|nr:energy transducer TonB [Lewinellaceae bacterium]
MDFSVTANWLGIAFLGIVALVLGLIYGIRASFAGKSSQSLSKKYEKGAEKSVLDVRNKYPDVDVFQLSSTFFNVGLMLAIGLTVLAFSWTTYEKVVVIPAGALEFNEEIEIEPPRTAEPPPPPPPPPPPVIQEVPEEMIEEEDVVEFTDQSIEEETVVEAPKMEAAPPPPPPPPPPQPKVEEIFKVVEDMPRFPGCEDQSNKDERKKCAETKMLEYIYKNIKYPAIARENGVEGTVVITFVVEKDGSITDARVARDIGAQCGQEALRVVEEMPKWVPGKQRGRAVRVQFNLPVKFRLE